MCACLYVFQNKRDSEREPSCGSILIADPKRGQKEYSRLADSVIKWGKV